MNDLAAALKDLGRLTEAEALVRKTLQTWRRELGADHVRTLQAMNKLADVLQTQGQVAEAETLWREALTAQRRGLERDSPQRLVTTNTLAGLLRQLRKPAEAEPLPRGGGRALDVAHLPAQPRSMPDRPATVRGSRIPARAQLPGSRASLGVRHEHTHKTLERLIGLHEA